MRRAGLRERRLARGGWRCSVRRGRCGRCRVRRLSGGGLFVCGVFRTGRVVERFFDDDPPRIARDHLHRQMLRRKIRVAVGRQQRERVAVRFPARDPLRNGRHPLLRFDRDAERQLVRVLDHDHRVAHIERQRVVEHADRVERRVRRQFRERRAHRGRKRRAGTEAAEHVVTGAGNRAEQQPRGAKCGGRADDAGAAVPVDPHRGQRQHQRHRQRREYPRAEFDVQRCRIARIAEATEEHRAERGHHEEHRIAREVPVKLRLRDERQIHADQQRERRRDRQRIGQQLRMRCAEEQEDKDRPHQQQNDRREAVRLARRLERAAHALHAERQPRQKPDEQHRHEVVERAGAVLLGRQIAPELLDDKKEIEELGVAVLHEHEPRRDDREEHDQPADEIQAFPDRPVARDQRVQHERRAGQDQPDEALGQHRERHRRPACPHPAAHRAARQVGTLREQQRAQREFHPERQGHVERVEVAHQVPVRRACEHDCREEAGGRIEHARAGEADQQHAREAGQRGIEARLPFAEAEPREGECVGPGLQRRLLEILVAVIARRDPVAGHEHLARHFGITAFVAWQQVAPAERHEPDQRERDQQEQDNGAIER
ncbi:hypothetical protein LMG29739_05748 [Paraburkholderia solisilvae]|uniref:Uncharacterized protein n=1 Tax=Paraburkholderia solisilvae TaxID=624376 RepID=A0A6J5EYH3_9BURK|nr:hypothetical protein LMG29739_05748 [Paraburkholderia solisilvae]